MATPRYAGFDASTLEFLRELERNNNRDWFKENKARYEEQVLDVALRFIQSMQQPLAEIAPAGLQVPGVGALDTLLAACDTSSLRLLEPAA